MRFTQGFWAGLALLASTTGVANTAPPAAAPPAATGTVSATAPVATPGSLIGILDLRPSLTATGGKYYSENAAEVGYKFNSRYSLSYVQFFSTNFFTPDNDATSGVNVSFPGGFIRGRINNFVQNGDFSISYQNRTYLPYTRAEYERGKVAVIRNYFNFRQKLNDTFAVTVTEMPVLQLYSKAGHAGAANPAFENRVYLTPEINLTSKLTVYLPILFHQTKHRNFQPGAANNDAWTFMVWINPEVYYSLNANTTIGLGYYSGNLVKADLSGTDTTAGLDSGVVQAILTLNL